MRCVVASVAAVVGCVSVVSCTAIPPLPPDFALPVREILQASSCELQHAFQHLDRRPEYDRFKPRQWLVTMTLTPKVDTEINPGIGWTHRSPVASDAEKFIKWDFGGPGFQLDAKGERSGTIAYVYISEELIFDDTLVCEETGPRLHALTQHLGIKNWLVRTADAMRVSKSVNIDKPTLTSEISIKFSAGGSWAYTFPAGINLASLSGNYSLDEQFEISMAPIPDKAPPLKVVTLPDGGTTFRPRSVTSSVAAIQQAQQRLDIIQLEQAIRKIQARP